MHSVRIGKRLNSFSTINAKYLDNFIDEKEVFIGSQWNIIKSMDIPQKTFKWNRYTSLVVYPVH